MSSRMWFARPASEWTEGLPVGNGVLAGMVMGTVPEERIALNHEWLWRAKGRFRDVEPRHQHLAEIRRLFFEGRMMEAGQVANEKLGGLGGVSGRPHRVDPYQPAGDLFLECAHGKVGSYRRELDLCSALAAVSYTADGDEYRREIFAHSTLPVICARVRCSREGGLVLNARLSRIPDAECTLIPSATEDRIRLRGEFTEAVQFCILARMLSPGATTAAAADAASLRVSRASEAAVLLTIAVALDGEDPLELAEAQLDRVPTDWDELLDGHKRAHAALYGRTSLWLGDSRDELPTDERLAALRAGGQDNGLMALYFHFGLYLLISSSRPGGLPANLQGKWNEELAPPWDCDLHQDVNLQMNYWPAEVCGLTECIEPLFDHMERFVPHAREAARALYDCRGVFFPIQTDPWGRATPESRGWDVWTGAAAWLAQHMWWRYEYGLDATFLRERAYPFLKEVAAFYEDYLVRDPAGGKLVTVPSQSPENTFEGGTKPVSLCVAATMDLELIHDVLDHATRAAEILGVDEELREKWRAVLADLPPLQIGKHGQLQEWLEDYEEAEPGHRHISHLFGLFPGDQLTAEREPELTQAARVSLARRLAAGGGHTGWSRAWTVCSWARLGEGDLACEHLGALLSDHTTASLLDLHPPDIFQVEGNMGGAAGMAEMLLQSHGGVIRLLPALPSAWPAGRVSGLRARGGFVIDMEWADGRLQEALLRSTLGGRCCVEAMGRRITFDTEVGGEHPLQWD